MDTNQLLEGVRLPPVHAKNVPLICELLGIKTVEDVLGHGETWAAMIRGPSWDLCSRGRLSAAEAAIAWQLLRDVAARTSASPSASTRLTPTVLGSGDMAPSLGVSSSGMFIALMPSGPAFERDMGTFYTVTEELYIAARRRLPDPTTWERMKQEVRGCS
jgi:hypothetical protein